MTIIFMENQSKKDYENESDRTVMDVCNSFKNEMFEDSETLGIDVLFDSNDAAIKTIQNNQYSETIIEINNVDECKSPKKRNPYDGNDNLQNITNLYVAIELENLAIEDKENVETDKNNSIINENDNEEDEEDEVKINEKEENQVADDEDIIYDSNIVILDAEFEEEEEEDIYDDDDINGDGDGSGEGDDSDVEIIIDETKKEIRRVATEAELMYTVVDQDEDLDFAQDCVICFISPDTYLGNGLVFCSECESHYCFSCLQSHIESKISQSSILITCPGDTGDTGCAKTLSEQLISAFSSSKMMSILIKNQVEVENNPNKKTCPGCHKVEKCNNTSSKMTPITCSSCDILWCFSCHSPWHSGITCSQYQKDIVKGGKKALKYWAKNSGKGSNNAKKCPKCHFYIERISGCDHMICNKCKTNFCYRCGGKHYSFGFLGDHHSTYSFAGCKYNLYPNKPALRIGVRAGVATGTVVLSPLLLACTVVFGVLILPVFLIRKKC